MHHSTKRSAAPVGRMKIDEQKKTNISGSTALFPLKIGVRLEHMYTKVWDFLDPAV